jgi:hypothetical protein
MKSVLFAITISLSLFLTSSCAGQTPTLEQNTANLSPNLTIEQQQKVFSNILNTLEYADEHNDSQYLKNRLYGPELKIRTAQLTEKRYTNKMPNTAVIPQMTDQLIISNNSGWPRINAIITKPTSDMQSQRLLFITQNNARNNYKLWGLVRIFPNTTLPKFNSALNGSQSLLSDDSTLLKSPSQVLNDYADFLQNANKSNTNSQFNTDPFMEQLNSITNTVQQGVNQNLGSQSQNYKADINNLQAVRTADGGALIMGQIDSYWKRTAGGGRLSKPASTEEEAIFGNTPARQTILVHYINVVAIYIPVKNNPSQSIQVIGAERMPVDAKAE